MKNEHDTRSATDKRLIFFCAQCSIIIISKDSKLLKPSSSWSWDSNIIQYSTKRKLILEIKYNKKGFKIVFFYINKYIFLYNKTYNKKIEIIKQQVLILLWFLTKVKWWLFSFLSTLRSFKGDKIYCLSVCNTPSTFTATFLITSTTKIFFLPSSPKEMIFCLRSHGKEKIAKKLKKNLKLNISLIIEVYKNVWKKINIFNMQYFNRT